MRTHRRVADRRSLRDDHDLRRVGALTARELRRVRRARRRLERVRAVAGDRARHVDVDPGPGVAVAHRRRPGSR